MENKNIANVPGTADNPPPQASTPQPAQSTTECGPQPPSAANLPNQQSKINNLSRPAVDQQSDKTLDDIINFIGQYLHCSDQQRTVLALWVLHTHCFSSFQVTPYLSIHSDREESGKTLCLQLLSLLCPNPALTANFTGATVSTRIHSAAAGPPTFLLDDCDTTLGSRRRARNPVLRSILGNGFHRGHGHSDRKGERAIFSPKAFAGIGTLPFALAERSLPILLEWITKEGKQKTRRFNDFTAAAEAKPLFDWLEAWGKENLDKLKCKPSLNRGDFPPDLSPRQQDVIEPLLQIAHQLGGNWPKRAAEAITTVLIEEQKHQGKEYIELLSDIRAAFHFYGDPKRINTATLLAWLQSQPNRRWNDDRPINSNRLAAMLAQSRVQPRSLRIGDEKPHRGYVRDDFTYLFFKLLPREARPDLDTQRLEVLEEVQNARKANKDAACSNAATPRADSPSASAAPPETPPVYELPVAPDPMAWLPPILMPSDSASYNYGPHSSQDLPIIRHFGAQGYKALSEMEARRIEFSCGNLPFGTMAPRTSLQYPAMPVRSFKRAEPPMTEEERAAAMEKIRRDREAMPKCAERENFRIAPQKRR